ncbi:MAG: triose-phosphate isomerase [Owenweeksia sp.]|nr:triose-phosphate isomerase [Owenweeksia sp.]MBF98644.1 triose-phosphate isomerase [Owenweeksia sp.]HBF21918.1 triose-phosphate isomerase [Cryomorphaceae bacterium]HCQ15686.1 triose-phosphate isomerase [Cryomorphaceae bacterium]|tara:strand:+ start:6632 stop:7393 length:762 start_codon:yes stop_codon:yes gene_type:complete
MDLIVAGNWKMNMTLPEGREFLNDLKDYLSGKTIQSQLILGVPFIHLGESQGVKESGIYLAAQNCSQYSSGAYTGEVSAAQVESTGSEYVILGHSERRQYFGDSDHVINQKIREALSNNLRPIFCVGELLQERQNGNQENVVNLQLENGLNGISESEMEKIIIAYEPVWAIGTGETASPEQAEEMHASIRKRLGSLYTEDVAQKTPILYGGSVKPDNAKDIFGQPNVNGGLIGGASLKLDSYTELIRIAEELA